MEDHSPGKPFEVEIKGRWMYDWEFNPENKKFQRIKAIPREKKRDTKPILSHLAVVLLSSSEDIIHWLNNMPIQKNHTLICHKKNAPEYISLIEPLHRFPETIFTSGENIADMVDMGVNLRKATMIITGRMLPTIDDLQQAWSNGSGGWIVAGNIILCRSSKYKEVIRQITPFQEMLRDDQATSIITELVTLS